jgi:hypothetical protein
MFFLFFRLIYVYCTHVNIIFTCFHSLHQLSYFTKKFCTLGCLLHTWLHLSTWLPFVHSKSSLFLFNFCTPLYFSILLYLLYTCRFGFYLHYTCLPSVYLFTFWTLVYILYTCLYSVPSFTFCTLLYILYNCLPPVHLFTACTLVYRLYTCLPPVHLVTMIQLSLSSKRRGLGSTHL